ncbi:hypothetical protein IAT38_001951 [Cryptococcus sp. DSM 104549]
MGGNAFPTPARRIPKPTYAALAPLILSRLSPLFQIISTPRNLLSKVDHGDLDVLCGYPATVEGGDEEWVPREGGKWSGGEMVKLGKRLPEGEKAEELREVLGRVREVLGATGWRRRGTDVSFKVSCGIMKGTSVEEDTALDDFYQIDLILVPPTSVDFITFTSSYSGTVLIIGHILRLLSPALTLHLTHLVIKHLPFPGVPNVEVALCDDPERLCEWMGWDYGRWVRDGEGWVEERELWEWVVDVEAGSRAGDVLERMAGSKSRKKEDTEEKEGKVGKEAKPGKVKRASVKDRFYEWLRIESRWAIPRDDSSGESGQETPGAPLAPSPSPATTSSLAASPSLAVAPSPTRTPQPPTPNPSYIDPTTPLPLDPRAIDALAYWGQTDAYNAVLQERQEVARGIAERQAARTERKEKARVALAEQLAEKEKMTSTEEAIVKTLGGLSIQ